LNTRIDYEKVLNPAQLDAVMTTQGPVLVIAGAGSGKTRTLVYRVARLVELGVEPESVLLLTFTRRAAQEMLERAATLSDPRCRFVSGGTFHGIAYRVLRRHAEKLGFSNSFTIMDRADMEEVIHALLPELQVPKGSARFPKRSTLANILSKASNLEVTVDALMEEEYGQFLEFCPQMTRLGQLYRDYKRAHQLMDYDDLITYFRGLLVANEDVRRELTQQYGHIMVDEYQDTNAIQADIVHQLAGAHRNIMVVGDDSQSIYSFRGANYRNMFEFPERFPEVKIIKLEENYRSTQPILDFTNAIMARASEKYTKCLFTRQSGGETPAVIDTRTEPEQALFVCRHVKEALARGRALRDLAVLFRAAYHSFELELELTRQGIPYVKYGGFKFMESAHIKDFLAHLRAIINHEDAVSWGRILRLIKNVGHGKSQAIIQWMKKSGVPPDQVGNWPGQTQKDSGLKALSQVFSSLMSNETDPRGAVERLLEYYLPILRDQFDDYPRRQREIEQLIPMAGRYRRLRAFIDDLVLEPPTSPADMDPDRKTDVLTLSTVHSAKGLEWPFVYIIWLMEGRFPQARAYVNPQAVEEERRLLYVASTRAKERLVLCYPGREGAASWGGQAWSNGGLSSFVAGLPRDVVRYETETSPSFTSARERPLDLSPTPPAELRPGDRVSHPAFGPGVVSKLIEGNKVEVLFRNFGRKLLHLGYTSLEKA
jgi:DNA helicase-2/ATP-dependent DNA helicase PcrA